MPTDRPLGSPPTPAPQITELLLLPVTIVPHAYPSQRPALSSVYIFLTCKCLERWIVSVNVCRINKRTSSKVQSFSLKPETNVQNNRKTKPIFSIILYNKKLCEILRNQKLVKSNVAYYLGTISDPLNCKGSDY